MTFKTTWCPGWRECVLKDGTDRIRINIPSRAEQKNDPGTGPYIEAFAANAIDSICVALTRKELRKLAYKIIKELK